MRKIFILALTVALAMAATALAVTQARISGKVLDAATKKPIENATVTVTSTKGKTYKDQVKTRKDGSYAVMVLDGTIPYDFEWSAPGYRAYKENIKLKLGEPNFRDIALMPGSGEVATATVPASEIKMDPAVEAFNTGAALANEGRDAEAVQKFEEAVAAKPDLTAGWQALAKLSLRVKNYNRAIEAANKGLEVDSEDTDMFAVLFEAYTAKGDKAKAAEFKNKMPANPSVLFNDAARAINAGKDNEAEPLLKKAIAADEKFALAYYELGMIYIRAGKNAEARANLERYIELDPNGKDAATAKEMLKYVK